MFKGLELPEPRTYELKGLFVNVFVSFPGQTFGQNRRCSQLVNPVIIVHKKFVILYVLSFSFAEGRNLPMERRHQVLENGTLIIKKVVRKDTGMYACSVVNRHGNSATQSGQLNVIGESQ